MMRGSSNLLLAAALLATTDSPRSVGQRRITRTDNDEATEFNKPKSPVQVQRTFAIQNTAEIAAWNKAIDEKNAAKRLKKGGV